MDDKQQATLLRIAIAAEALLERLDTLTTDQFSIGAEHREREALRAALGAALGRETVCACNRCA